MNTEQLPPKIVLVIGYVWPEPNSSAAGSHMLSLLELFVSRGWTVNFASPAVQGEHKVNLTGLGIREHKIALNCSSFDTFIRELNPDIVLFDRFMLEEQFGWRVATHCPKAIRILDTEDLHCLRDARHQALKQDRPMTKEDLHTEMAQREVAAIFRCDLSLIISDYEMELLQEQFSVPAFLLHYCPFMLDLSPLNSPSLDWQHRQHFISIGNFRHAPNWDAVLYLKQSIWPLIRQQLPRAECHVYGAYPPPKATQLHNQQQGFLIKGWAFDARQVMGDARVCLAPLRFGAGIKGKLTEAMLCGTPSITTDIGVEGMQGTFPWPGQVSNDSQQFAAAAVALYQDEASWNKAQKHGNALLKGRFDRQTLAPVLLARIEAVQQKLSTHRLKNFIGAMLQHHHHKSTQYMAQWIEAKNRTATDD